MPNREKVIERLGRVSYYFKSLLAVGWQGDADTYREHMESVNMALALLKEQEAKTGHWIEKEDYAFDTYYDCSVCGESWSTIEGTPWENGMNYCPHCGAKMEGQVRWDG